MFARHFEARHRSGALPRARKTAARLKDTGDLPGCAVWCEVADKIERLRNDQRHIALRREREKI
jgi:hypothetical protein